MPIWLLVVLFLNASGSPVIGVEAFSTEAACKAAIPAATASVLTQKATDASINCTLHEIGKLS